MIKFWNVDKDYFDKIELNIIMHSITKLNFVLIVLGCEENFT